MLLGRAARPPFLIEGKHVTPTKAQVATGGARRRQHPTRRPVGDRSRGDPEKSRHLASRQETIGAVSRDLRGPGAP